MLRLVEDGEMYRLRKHWDARRPECIESAKKTIKHVGVEEFSCALIVMAIGVVVSLIVLLIEVLLESDHIRNREEQVEKAITMCMKVTKGRNKQSVIVPYVN